MSTGERELPGAGRAGPEVRLLALRADVSGALARGGDLRAVLQQCAEALVRHLDAAFARVWTLDRAGNVLELQASAGLYTHLDGPHSRVPVGALKIGRIAREKRPHLTNDVPNDPQVSDREWAAREGIVAFAGYPLLVEGEVAGVVALFARHPLSEAALEALALSADGIAQFIARKQVEQERAALLDRRAAEHAFVAEASTVLASSLDYQTLLASVARLAVPRLADWCAVHVADEDGSLRQLAVAHVDPAKVELARELNRRYPPDPAAPRGVPQVVRTGRAELVPEITDGMLARGARDPDHLGILRDLGLKSCMLVPMAARGRTLGALTFVSAESGRRYGPEDLALAEDLGRRAAVAIDNARLYGEAQEALRLREQAVGQLSLLVEASTSLTGRRGLPAVLGAILDL